MPHLQIVDRALWSAVQSRIERFEKAAGGAKSKQKRKSGTVEVTARQPRPVRIPTMLGGLLDCGVCGGRMGVERRTWGTPEPGKPRKRATVYHCMTRRYSGKAACSNSARRLVAVVDELLTKWIRSNVFTQAFVEACVADVTRKQKERARTSKKSVTGWEQQAKRLRAEVDKLANALLSAGSRPEAVIRMISEREAKLRELDAKILERRSHRRP